MSGTRRLERRNEGPASNGQQAQTQRETRVGGAEVRSTTISFTAPATIADSGNGLARFPVGARVRVQGSSLNNREFVVVTSSAGSLTVRPALIRTEAAGASVELRRLG